MIHSYDVDVALAVGGAPEAVVLKEIACWCRKNRENGNEEQDGRYWMYKSIAQWKDDFPEYKGSIDNILNRLEKGGWIVTGVYNKHSFDHTKSYALSDSSISLFARIELAEEENGTSQIPTTIPSGKTSGRSTEEIIKKNADLIDRLYALYPTRCETRDGMRSTGKCSKDKVRIASLLKTHTPELIERSIKMYLQEQGGKYLKNFSTFLNNMPEYEDDTVPTLSEEDRLRALGYQ